MASNSLVSALGRRLEGKVAIITGGASGIGECTAKLFSKHGAKVVIADVQDELGHAVVKSMGPVDSTYIHCDVTDEDHVRNAVDRTVSTYGKLDIIFNNAAYVDSPKPMIDNKKEDLERVININIVGVFLGMKHAARAMVPARSGTIISTASMGTGISMAGTHAYTCSKHAVVGLTKNLAVELGKFGIRVNCVSPYAVATNMATKYGGVDPEVLEQLYASIANLKGPILKADDIANAALFLASEEAKYISGQNLFVDGGMSIVNSAFATLNHPES